jgi:hypothetical protein
MNRRGVGRAGGGAVWLPSYTTGLVLLADAHYGITLNGTRVATWEDQSGAANDLVQSAAGNQPLYEATGLNGKPTLSFVTARTDWMGRFGGTLCDAARGNDNPYTLFMVCAQQNTAGLAAYYAFTNSTAANPRLLFYQNGAASRVTQYRRDDTGAASGPVGSGTGDTTAHVISHVFAGTTGSAYIDGDVVLNGQACNVGVTTVDLFTIAAERLADVAQSAMTVKISAVLVYDGALSAGDRASVEAELKTRWDTP